MLTVEDYGQIRRAHRDGLSIRAIAGTLHHSRRKVREALAKPEPRPYTRTKDPPAPALGPFKVVIDAILAAEEQAPRKQRHAATQSFVERLRTRKGVVSLSSFAITVPSRGYPTPDVPTGFKPHPQ